MQADTETSISRDRYRQIQRRALAETDRYRQTQKQANTMSDERRKTQTDNVWYLPDRKCWELGPKARRAS